MKRILLLFIFIFGTIFADEEIKIRKKQSNEEVTHDYCVELLKIALKNTEKEYGKVRITNVDMQLSQGRSFEEISKGKLIDIDWGATSIEREKDMLPIRIPLFKGLLGYRVPVINKKDLEKFNKVKNLNDLKKFSIIQGTAWPDTEILEHSGFTLVKNSKFENLYPMLEDGRGDSFCRSICEAYGEVKTRGNSNLIVYDRIILAYKLPLYFFVNKNSTKLAERVEKGLLIAIKNGDFLELMKSNPLTKSAFPLDKYKNSLIFELENPILPKETPINDKKLWINF